MNYFKRYELLYKLGYHSKAKNHGAKYAKQLCMKYQFKRILDVGCSNGIAVHKFMKMKKHSYGIDVSQIAIRLAAEKEALVPNCVLGSLTDIPFKNKFFDAVFSCDVLEHLERKDVGRAISEMVRVCRSYIFVIIDCDIERNREWIDKAKKEFPADFAGMDNLHLTVMPQSAWIKLFARCGAKFMKRDGDILVFTVC